MRDTTRRPFLGLLLWVVITLAVMPGLMAQTNNLPSTPTTASFALKTGNDYLSACGKALDAEVSSRVEGIACLSYMRGLAAGVVATQGVYMGFKKQPELLCVPTGATMAQLMSVSLKYLNDHPADLHRRLGDLIFVSWVESFPCPKSP